MCKEDDWKTAYRIWYSYFEYQIMLFGLFNSFMSFQGYINMFLGKKIDIVVIVNLNNIPIYTNKAIYVHVIWWVFNQLQKYSLYVNLKKCHFHWKEL